jgi:hypothetical protein
MQQDFDKKLSAFNCITFKEDTHKYFIHGQEASKLSVTGLISKYKPKFEEDKWARIKAKSLNISVEEMKFIWSEKNLYSTTLGTELHRLIECVYTNQTYNFDSNKIKQSLDNEDKMALVKAVQPKLSGGLENFLKSSVKSSSIKEEEEFDLMDFLEKNDVKDSKAEVIQKIAYGAVNFIRGFAKVNILSTGMIPFLTAAAIERLGGYPILASAASLVGASPFALGIISIIGTFIGAILVWKLVDMITGEDTNVV